MRKIAGIPRKTGAFISLFLGIVSVVEATRLYPYRTDFWAGDHIFPGLIGAILVAAGLFLLLKREESSRRFVLPGGKIGRKMTATAGVLISYCLLIGYAGYVFSTFLAFLFLLRIIGNYRWADSALFSGLFTCALYLLFSEFLKTPLPNGFLF